MSRVEISPKEISSYTQVQQDIYPFEKAEKLTSNLALPSYVHGYSLAIQFMTNWFESKFEKDFFKTVYVDGKHVLDDYKKFSKSIVKGVNPRLRIEPRIEYDYDRENIDSYMAPPQMYLRKSKYNESFFKDEERDIFLGIQMKALRMSFNYKVRVNTRAQQLDVYNKMQLYFRNGSTMHENLTADFHVPKEIILNIADRAGFEIKNNEVINIIEFINYLNRHSEIPFLFKIRAINQHPEFFIRVKNLYTHINCIDKMQLDDGERDGKLDFNFHIEMNTVLTMPIPHFYAYYSATDLTTSIQVYESDKDCIAIYSINPLEIPKRDSHGWLRAAITEYATDKGDTEMDLSSLFEGENSLSKAINHSLTQGISPLHFINIMVYDVYDIARLVPITINWETKTVYFNEPQDESIFEIAMYFDREYLNEIDIELNNYNSSRISN